MLKPEQWLWAVLILWNLVTFILYAADKAAAVRNGHIRDKYHLEKYERNNREHRRIPERTLLLAAACFGSAGALLSMLIFRHKINVKTKKKFVIGVPVMLVVQIAVLFFVKYKLGI